MDRRPLNIAEPIRAFERTLRIIAAAMNEALGPNAWWGLCGFREESLVMLLAETMRSLGWQLEYEKSYEQSYQRGDIDAVFPEYLPEHLWIEAKWWWLPMWNLNRVLSVDEPKLRLKGPEYHTVEVVFTADEIGKTEGRKCWTSEGAGDWMMECLREEHLEAKWRLLGFATAPSPYALICPAQRRVGLFSAHFFEYLGRD